MIVSLVATLFCFAPVIYALPVHVESDAKQYLRIFSHFKKTGSGAFTEDESMLLTIRDFHKFSDLTGSVTQFPELAEEKYGSSLDLNHMNKLPELMEPHYKDFKPQEENDIKAPINAPDICQDTSLDTITQTHDGSVYVFKGDFYWKIIYNVTADGYPRRISDDWDGLEGHLDASFTRLDGRTYFFKGNLYWKFFNKKMDIGYPKLISDGFKGIPDNLDAVLTWSGDGKSYFFKGSNYWRYDFGENPPVKDTYPSSITEWKGLPLDGIDAAFLWENYVSYFFKGVDYYRLGDETFEVSKLYNYPAPTGSNWFSCKNGRISSSDENITKETTTENNSGVSILEKLFV